MREDFYPYYFRIEDRHWWFVGRRRVILGLLDDALGPGDARGRRVLDVGCGTGTMLSHLERYGEPIGIEADDQAVAFCRARGVTRVRQADPPPLPFDDSRFDLVTALDVLEHVDDDQRLLGEMRRVLRPGGVALVTVPAFRALWSAQDVVSQHRRRYRAAVKSSQCGYDWASVAAVWKWRFPQWGRPPYSSMIASTERK